MLDWFWGGNVQEAVVDQLAAVGWRNRRDREGHGHARAGRRHLGDELRTLTSALGTLPRTRWHRKSGAERQTLLHDLVSDLLPKV